MLTLSMSGSIVVVLLTKAAEDHLMMQAFFFIIVFAGGTCETPHDMCEAGHLDARGRLPVAIK